MASPSLHPDALGAILEYPQTPASDGQHSHADEHDEHDDAQHDHSDDSLPHIQLRPVVAARTASDPPPSALLQAHWSSTNKPASSATHRNRSPYSRSHLRSRSSGAALSVPLTRAHSSPGFLATSRLAELPTLSTTYMAPNSPMRSPARQHSPLRKQEEQTSHPVPRLHTWYDSANNSAIESIEEDRELDLTAPRQPTPSTAPMHVQFSRSSSLRRRPASPLHNNASAGTTAYPTELNPLLSSTASSGSNSPSLGPQRYNEAYPSLHHYASSSSFSSIPSTPTSQRSRSPSISSLETIEDAPDLESEAIEAERMERLKLAAEREERIERGEEVDEPPRRSSLDVPKGFGFARSGNRERKRWSVCGGERRADLDLETIWED